MALLLGIHTNSSRGTPNRQSNLPLRVNHSPTNLLEISLINSGNDPLLDSPPAPPYYATPLNRLPQ